jgi:hypothetical protein
MKEVKDFYNENYKSLKKEIKEEIRRLGKSHMLMDWQNQYCENDYTTKSNLYFQCNPHQKSNDILHRDRKKSILKFMKTLKTSNSQSNPEQKEQC